MNASSHIPLEQWSAKNRTALLRELGLQAGRLEELVKRAKTERLLGALDVALATWGEIEQLAEGMDEVRLLAKLTRAEILLTLECPIEAADIALDAVIQAADVPDLLLRARATYAMAEAEAGNLERAIDSYDAWIRAEHEPSRMARLLLAYSELARRHGKPRLAIRTASDAAAISRDLGQKDLAVIAQVALGAALALNPDRLGWAQAELRIARDLCRELGDRAGEARVLSLMADVSRLRGKQRRAETRMRQALAIARELEDMELWDQVAEGLGAMNPVGAELGAVAEDDAKVALGEAA